MHDLRDRERTRKIQFLKAIILKIKMYTKNDFEKMEFKKMNWRQTF